MHSQPCFAQGSQRLAQARLPTALGQIATYASRASDSADAKGKPGSHHAQGKALNQPAELYGVVAK